MDTEAVRLFVVAADLLNISAAGRQLGLAPAVASARLAKLEHQVGADLLHRSTRKVSLSLQGAEFLPFARDMIAQEDAALAALGHGRAEITGTLRFAASSSFAQLYVVPHLSEFLGRHPRLNIDLRLSDTQVNLIQGGFDLALRNYAIEDSGLRARKLAPDRRILCASPEYLAEYGAPQTAEDLGEHRLITFAGSAPRNLLRSDGQTDGQFPPAKSMARVICDDGASMRVATSTHVGISMNSMWSVRDMLRSGALIRVLPHHEIADQSAIWLVYPKSNVLTAKVRVFIDYLIEKIGTPPVWER